MTQVFIRQEREADYAAVDAVNKAAFAQDSEARLVALLRKSAAFIRELSLVAELEGKVVGHILFTRILIRDHGGHEHPSLALAPMAVLPEVQQQGIGSQLVRSGLARARELGYPSVIVLGHAHYYPRFGFVPAAQWNIKAPFDVPAHVFMAIELAEDGLRGVSGTVEYPEAFAAVT